LASSTPEEPDVVDAAPVLAVVEVLDELLLPHAATSTATAITSSNDASPFGRLNMRSSPQ